MAHFAEVDSNNTVVRVLVVPDQQEHRGQEFLADDLALGGTWVQTSYNANIRKHYAGIGMTFDPALDAFIPIKCHDTAALDTDTCTWVCDDPTHTIILGEENV